MQTAQDLLAAIALETIEKNIFRGKSHDIGSPNVFGGQVLTQALHAAILTVPEDRFVHSLHAYFILPGDLTKDIVFEVDRIRDGGSFTTRRVVAIQKGRAIFNLSASFQKEESGLAHQIPMPNVQGPEGLETDFEIMTSLGDLLPKKFRRYIRPRPIEFRPVDKIAYINPVKQPPYTHVWMRANGPVPDDKTVHQRILAYVSDYNLLSTATLPHKDEFLTKKFQMASLDHAIWFHRNFRIDDWLLYALDSPSASNGRGFTRGNVFTREGELVASIVQEGLMRKKEEQ